MLVVGARIHQKIWECTLWSDLVNPHPPPGWNRNKHLKAKRKKQSSTSNCRETPKSPLFSPLFFPHLHLPPKIILINLSLLPWITDKASHWPIAPTPSQKNAHHEILPSFPSPYLIMDLHDSFHSCSSSWQWPLDMFNKYRMYDWLLTFSWPPPPPSLMPSRQTYYTLLHFFSMERLITHVMRSSVHRNISMLEASASQPRSQTIGERAATDPRAHVPMRLAVVVAFSAVGFAPLFYSFHSFSVPFLWGSFDFKGLYILFHLSFCKTELIAGKTPQGGGSCTELADMCKLGIFLAFCARNDDLRRCCPGFKCHFTGFTHDESSGTCVKK